MKFYVPFLFPVIVILCGPELAFVSAYTLGVGSVASPYTLGPGRMLALSAIVLTLIAVGVGIQGLRRQKTGAGTGRRGAFVALAAGLAGFILGVLVVFTSPGGVGTGNGRGGGYLAMFLGTIALIVAGVLLARSRRSN